MRCFIWILWLTVTLGLAISRAETRNQVANAGFEGLAQSNLPTHWEPLIIGAPASFAIDPADMHSGARSLRITATETSRAYIRSQPIPVAPGERLRFSAWVKHQNVPAGKGTVIAIAEFTNAKDLSPTVAKLAVADTAKECLEWHKLENTIQVPEAAAFLRLRLGFSYAMGNCWWDDVSVACDRAVVARIDLPTARLSPATPALPVVILNREQDRGEVEVAASVGNQSAAKKIALTGNSLQRAEIPVEISARGQNVPVAVILKRAGATLHADKRKVVVPPPLVLAPPLPTHWVVEDGSPTIEGRVDLAVPQETLTGGILQALLRDSSGNTQAVWVSREPLKDGPNDFKLSRPKPLPEGDYNLVVDLKPAKEGKPLRAEQTWSIIPRRLARVTLDKAGYPVYDGKLIFPLGIFNGGAKTKEMGEAGFNVAHSYNSVEATFAGRPDDLRAREFLDSSHRAGLKVLMLVPRNLAFHGDWDGVRRRVRLFRNHPGLLAWDEEEGMARGDIKLPVLEQLRDIIHQEDPNHPIMIGDSKDVIGRIAPDRADFFPVHCMDMGMWWWYPLPLGGNPTALEGDEGPRGTELVPPVFLANRRTDKPLWVGVQSYKKPASWARYPSPIEYRAQAYIAIAHGARGLMWYGGSVTGGIYLDPKAGHWDYLKSLATELRELSAVLVGDTMATPAFEPAPAQISTTIKRGGGRVVLIAANRGAKEVQIVFRSEHLNGASAAVLNEQRSVDCKAGTLEDTFPPYAVHVYQLSASPQP